MKRIYMDYGSASPVDPRVIDHMSEYHYNSIGNPSSGNSGGRLARGVVETAKNQIAALIGVEDGRRTIFTSGATEANNLAVIGTALRYRDRGNRIIISSIEHMSVINAARYLAKEGFEIVSLPVNSEGIIDLNRLEDELDGNTVLVSVMYANGEIGTVEPVAQTGALTKDRGIPFHVDATAAAGKIPIDVTRENIDLLTISANDLYGPQGVGALYAGPDVKTQPLILGGGQQSGLRSGTENLAGISGFGKACEIAKIEMDSESIRLKEFRENIISSILGNIDRTHLTGHPEKRLPNHASFRFDYVEGESIILNLDMDGIQASTGSACSSKTLEPSHTLIALGLTHEEAHGSLVLTLGRWNDESDVEKIIEVLPGTIDRLRKLSPLAPGKGG